jgi:MFS family permease
MSSQTTPSSAPFVTPRLAVNAVFTAFGIGVGLWAGSIPTVAARSGISAEWLGYTITLIIAASLLGMMIAGAAARLLPLRRLVFVGMVLVALDMAFLLQAASFWSFLVCATLIGLTGGILDAAMNAEGYQVERDLGRPVIAGFHASASLAAALTAVLGSYVSVNFGTPITAMLTTLGFAAGLAIAFVGTPARPIPPPAAVGRARRVALPFILLGVVVGLGNGTETVGALFSSPFLAFTAPELAAYAGAGTTAFGLCQFAVRASADRLRARFGDLVLLEVSLVVTAIGFVIVAFSPGFAISVIGFGVIGIGTACFSPCGFALAPSMSGLAAAQAFGMLAAITAVTRVPVPLGFGQIVEDGGYRAAFLTALALLACGFGLAMLLTRAAPRAHQDG